MGLKRSAQSVRLHLGSVGLFWDTRLGLALALVVDLTSSWRSHCGHADAIQTPVYDESQRTFVHGAFALSNAAYTCIIVNYCAIQPCELLTDSQHCRTQASQCYLETCIDHGLRSMKAD